MNDFGRYIRQTQLPGFGEQAQQKLQMASVLVVGLGGLGVPVLQYLAGMGVGTLGLVDGDRIAVENLQRQVLYSEDDVGKLKAEVATDKIHRQNASLRLSVFPVFLQKQNAFAIIKDFDVVVDATDNFTARYLINDVCVTLGKPFVYGAVDQFEGHLSVFNYKNGPTYRCVYPHPPSPGQLPDCNTAGVLGAVPGVVGCWQAIEVIKVITGIGSPLSGCLQVFDFLHNEHYHFQLKTRPESRELALLAIGYEDGDGRQTSSPQEDNIRSITPELLYEWHTAKKDFSLLDVRSGEDYERMHLDNALHVPLDQLMTEGGEMPTGRPLVLLCQQGTQSLKAAHFLKKAYPDVEIYNLKGGMRQWIAERGYELMDME